MTTNDKNADPLRILLVEDSIESMNLTKRMLIDLGITQIVTAKNGSEAFDLIGSLESGVSDLAEEHRAHIIESLRRGR